MALATYFGRAALAASQVIAGFDSDLFRARVENASVGLTVGEDACVTGEGRHLADLCVRLLARLYPALRIEAADPALAEELRQLALSINSRYEAAEAPTVELVIGSSLPETGEFTVYAGSDGFTALVSTSGPRPVGATSNPFGSGVAACLATSLVFRHFFLDEKPVAEIIFSALDGAPELRADSIVLSTPLTLIGAGAIGNGALWALERTPLTGVLHVVDHERVELSNLQRYVLATEGDVEREKVDLPRACNGLDLRRHRLRFEQYVAQGGEIEHVLVALDSAEARRRIQAALPRLIDNAWTQPGDLAVSRHGRFGSEAACLYCLYLPHGDVPNEDQLVATALGLESQIVEVRRLLATGEPLARPFLDLVASSLGVSLEALLPFEGAPLRSLYAEGLCGGAIIPVEKLGAPRQEMHVPVAHQSALAGVLLAAAAVSSAELAEKDETEITRINVLRDLGDHLTQPARRAGDGVCICEDADYIEAYAEKWGEHRSGAPPVRRRRSASPKNARP